MGKSDYANTRRTLKNSLLKERALKLLIFLLLIIACNSSAETKVSDCFLERRLKMYAYCKAEAKLPQAAENLVQLGLKLPDESDYSPCDKDCFLKDRMVAFDAKRIRFLNDFLKSLKKVKKATRPIANTDIDSFIGLPDLGVCIFIDSNTGRIEVNGLEMTTDKKWDYWVEKLSQIEK